MQILSKITVKNIDYPFNECGLIIKDDNILSTFRYKINPENYTYPKFRHIIRELKYYIRIILFLIKKI